LELVLVTQSVQLSVLTLAQLKVVRLVQLLVPQSVQLSVLTLAPL